MSYTLKEITEEYKKVYHTDDDGSIALIVAIVVGSKMDLPPTWLYLIGPSSGGKTALIDTLGKIPFVTQISDLTSNTFLSGMNSVSGKETSLLKRLGPYFTITMKDFTTILSKDDQTQAALIAQMREIYDGHLTKETGLGKRLEWRGKATMIMASTEAIFQLQDKFSDMGTRATNYVLKDQDREATTLRALRNNKTILKDSEKLQDIFKTFIISKLDAIPKEGLPYPNMELEKEIVEVADFSAICRSIVKRDYRGAKNLALSPEMPMRIAKQLLSVSQLLTHVNDGELTDSLKQVVYKIGIDSIPKQRRLILRALGSCKMASVSGLSEKIQYPDERVKEWIEDLQMFDVVERIKDRYKTYWSIRERYRNTVEKYFGIVSSGEILTSKENEESASSSSGNYEDYSNDLYEEQKAAF